MKKFLFLFIATISLVACDFVNKQSSASTPSTPIVQTSPCEECEDEVVNLRSLLATSEKQIADLRVENATLKAEINCLLQNCNEVKQIKAPLKTYKPAPRTTVKAPTQITKSQPEVKETRTVKSSSAGTPNLSYLREGGEIIFCVRANGREDCYFPHYAIQNGVTFSNYASNQVKGYNWKVEPTDGYIGDYGVTKDGTFYVSTELIKTSLQKNGVNFETLEIKAPYTGWVNKLMSPEGEFMVYKTR